jgi:hypothetical protein
VYECVIYSTSGSGEPPRHKCQCPRSIYFGEDYWNGELLGGTKLVRYKRIPHPPK